MSKAQNKRVLAFHPYSQGLSFALYASEKEMIDCGNGAIRAFTNSKMIKRLEHYLAYYKPDIVLINSPIAPNKSKRQKRMLDLIKGVAIRHLLAIKEYSTEDIWNVFDQYACKTKYDIAQKLIESFPMLAKYEFQPRRPWEGQPYGIGVFDASALGIVHYFHCDKK